MSRDNTKRAFFATELVEKYLAKKKQPFVPGKTYLPPSGKVVGVPEVMKLLDAVADMHFTEGRFVDRFEEEIAQWLGVRYASMCNSGSSANLLALSAFTDKKISQKFNQNKTDAPNIITTVAGFPTTVNPIFQLGFVPNFIDVEIGTYVPSAYQIAEAINKNTVGIMLAHTMGNSLPIDSILSLCEEYGLFFIEDNCDALGSKYRGKYTGTFGDVSTLSLYPAHHITAGEGGVVFTNSPKIHKVVESFRDWGRACWCDPGEENTCGKRFDHCLKSNRQELPYDHKYIYDHIGYNLKSTDFQGAIALAQLRNRLNDFIRTRKYNFDILYNRLEEIENHILLPKATLHSEPSWFGFPITMREDDRPAMLAHLEKKKVGTRLLFGGNLLMQPAYQGVDGINRKEYPWADKIAKDTFWVGVWPGLDTDMMNYIADSILEFYGVTQ